MNWINNLVRPKIRSFLTTKRDVPDNLWRTCPMTGQMVFYKDLEANQFVFPGSDYHERMSATQRLEHLFDDAVYDTVLVPGAPVDPLKFRDGRRYTDRLKDAKAATELDDAILVGEGKLDGRFVVAAAQDFRFMAGSLGMAAGEAIIAGMLRAVEKKSPFILFAASGGARMQEGILSADADAANDDRRAASARKPAALHCCSDRSDHGRRNGELRDARRCAYRRTRRAHLLCRSARDPANNPRTAPRRLPAL